MAGVGVSADVCSPRHRNPGHSGVPLQTRSPGATGLEAGHPSPGRVGWPEIGCLCRSWEILSGFATVEKEEHQQSQQGQDQCDDGKQVTKQGGTGHTHHAGVREHQAQHASSHEASKDVDDLGFQSRPFGKGRGSRGFRPVWDLEPWASAADALPNAAKATWVTFMPSTCA